MLTNAATTFWSLIMTVVDGFKITIQLLIPKPDDVNIASCIY